MAAVTDRDLGWRARRREMAELGKLEVAVGVLAGSGASEDGVPIAEYATYNEYGTETIPARPANALAFDRHKGDINADFDAQTRAVLDGRRMARRALTIIGQKHADRIKNTITAEGVPPPNSPRTVAAKKGSTRTLVDTGAYVNAIQISVRGRT